MFMLSCAVVELLLIFHCTGNIIPIIDMNNNHSVLIISAIEMYFKMQNTIRIFVSNESHLSDQHLLYQHIFNNLKFGITFYSASENRLKQLNDMGKFIQNPSTCIGYVLAVDSDAVDSRLLKLCSKINANGRWLFLVTQKSDKSADIQKILLSAWHQTYMLNTLVIVFDEQLDQRLNTYYYNPFLSSDSVFQLVINEGTGMQDDLALLETALNFRMTNLHRHSLNISILKPNTKYTEPRAWADGKGNKFASIDNTNGAVLDYILEYFNADSYEQAAGRSMTPGIKLENGSFTGVLQLINDGVIELSVNNKLLTNLGQCNIAYLNSVSSSRLFYILPNRTPAYTDVMFSIFNRNAQVFNVLALVLISMTWYIVEVAPSVDRNRDDMRRKSFVMVVLDLCAVYYNIGIRELHTKLSFRIVFTLVLFYAFIGNNTYQGQITSKLSTPPASNNVQTLKQLLATSTPLHSYITSNDLYKIDNFTDTTSTIYKISQRNIFNDNFTYNRQLIIDIAEHHHDSASLVKEGTAIAIKAASYDPLTGDDTVHIVPESPASYFTAYTARRDSPFLTKYNKLIARAIESGFVVYGDNQLRFTNYLAYMKRYKNLSAALSQAGKKITMENVKPLFKLWAMAVVVAFGVFVIEVTWNKGKRAFLIIDPLK